MGAITRLSFEEFQKLPEKEGVRYELDEGELLMEPSPTYIHNRIRDSIARRLTEFVETKGLGEVITEMDFRLQSSTVRNPDVAFVTAEHRRHIDVNRSPVDGAPALAIEVISKGNPAEDIAKKVRQYLRAGCRSVWLVYPGLKRIEIHTLAAVKAFEAPETLTDETVLPGFSLLLSDIL